jgi:hypothetical protein
VGLNSLKSLNLTNVYHNNNKKNNNNNKKKNNKVKSKPFELRSRVTKKCRHRDDDDDDLVEFCQLWLMRTLSCYGLSADSAAPAVGADCPHLCFNLSFGFTTAGIVCISLQTSRHPPHFRRPTPNWLRTSSGIKKHFHGKCIFFEYFFPWNFISGCGNLRSIYAS